MASALTEAAVKRCKKKTGHAGGQAACPVFVFLLHSVRYQSHRMPRIEPWEQTKTTAHLKKENGMEELAFALTKPSGAFKPKAVLRKQDGVASPRQTWGSPDTAPQLCHGGSGFRKSPCRSFRFSGATWLDLSNLVARTEYHSRLVLSTLILRFFSQNRCTAGISALFLHSAQRKPFALEENPLVIYCFLKWFLLL